MKRTAFWIGCFALSASGCQQGSSAVGCPPCPPCAGSAARAPASASAPASAGAPAPAWPRATGGGMGYTPVGVLPPGVLGAFPTGVAIADMDGDGDMDLVVAAGNDLGLQGLMVFSNRLESKKSLPKRPDWLSADIDSNANLAVGDIDGDGGLDVAVSVICGLRGLDEDPAGGRVKVYFSRRGSDGVWALEDRPGWTSEDRFGSVGCALGDVDGDGDLDLVVSSFAEPETAKPMAAGGALRIYRNDRGKLSPRAVWKSAETSIRAGVPKVADADGDGLLDIVLPGEKTRVYRGALDAKGAVTIDPAASWTSSDGSITATYADVGPLGKDPRPSIVVSYNDYCHRSDVPCESSRFVAYRLPETTPFWRSSDGGLGSGLALADTNGDGLLDLVAGRWGKNRDEGAPLFIYRGEAQGLSSEPAFVSEEHPVIHAVAAGALFDRIDELPVAFDAFTIERPSSVVTLPRQTIAAVMEVTRAGARQKPGDFVTVPGGRWIAFARRLGAGERVTVKYAYPAHPDLALAAYRSPDDRRRGSLDTVFRHGDNGGPAR